jgi:hypothetical protein
MDTAILVGGLIIVIISASIWYLLKGPGAPKGGASAGSVGGGSNDNSSQPTPID